jgi:hypothetical protein
MAEIPRSLYREGNFVHGDVLDEKEREVCFPFSVCIEAGWTEKDGMMEWQTSDLAYAWAKKQCRDFFTYHYHGGTGTIKFYFVDPDDAMHFKIRWGV